MTVIRHYIVKWNARNRIEFAGYGRLARQSPKDKDEERAFLARFPTYHVDVLTNSLTDVDTPATLTQVQEILDYLSRRADTLKNVRVSMASDQYATYWTLTVKESEK